MKQIFTFHAFLLIFFAHSADAAVDSIPFNADNQCDRVRIDNEPVRFRCRASEVFDQPLPLLIIDRQVFEFNEIKKLNPDDIAAITVLRDIPAIALFGSQGTSGVIIITTRKAQLPLPKPGDTKAAITNECGKAKTRIIYPNPVPRNNSAYIEFQYGQDAIMQLNVVGLEGNLVWTQPQRITKGSNRLSVPVASQWPAGIYIVQLSNERGTNLKLERLIVE